MSNLPRTEKKAAVVFEGNIEKRTYLQGQYMPVQCCMKPEYQQLGESRYTIGALKIRTGFWGPLYYNYTKEPTR